MSDLQQRLETLSPEQKNNLYQRLKAKRDADQSTDSTDRTLDDKIMQQARLAQWDSPHPPAPTAHAEAGLQTLFEAQARQNPDTIALVDGDAQFTYEYLDQSSQQLAVYLRHLGVTVETKVGLFMERSWEMAVGILGILKAGGAYVPMDIAYPLSRLAFMLSDARVEIIVTQERLSEQLPAARHTLVYIDRDWPVIAQEPVETPLPHWSPDSPAYIIYTSGSTGTPKGVVITHTNVTRLLATTNATLHFDQHDTWTLFHSIAFDFSVWELWGPLLTGGRLVIVPYWTSRSTEDFHRLLIEERVTILNQTPSAFLQIVEAEKEGVVSSQNWALRLVIFGGEALDPTRLQPWFERHGDQFPQLVNMYGITETTVHVTYYQLHAEDASMQTGSIIGRPFPGFQMYILDADLKFVPTGTPGEIYVGGTGVARGYLSRPDLTAERFIPDPFGAAGTRIYKSGDLACYRENGSVEYIGRADDQVKVRGFRIELGEIENALKQYPEVQSALVLQREDVPGNRILVAYLCSSQTDDHFLYGLRAFLQNQLPEYMLPSAFVLLKSFPLTINGKIDRRGLPLPDEKHFLREQSLETSRTPLEDVVAAIWMQVLHLTHVNKNDNFFALGGHSLLTTQVISRLRKLFQVDIPLKYFFSAPTIVSLARYITTAIQADQQKSTLAAHDQVIPVADRTNVPLTFAQQRLWFLEQLEPRTSVFTNLIVFSIKGEINHNALQRTFREILGRHEIFRTSFPVINGGPEQVISPVSSIDPAPLRLIDLSMFPKYTQREEKERIIQEEENNIFDLIQGPLIRFTLLCGEESSTLLIAMHHAVFDGLSLNILFQEMSLFYNAFVKQEEFTLPPLPVQYADYAVWQQRVFNDEVLETQLAYWKRQLAGAPELLALPTDYVRPMKRELKGGLHVFSLPPSLVEGLKGLCQETGTTLFMVTFAAFSILLSRYSGQEDIIVGSPIANRTYSEMEKLIGLFVNILVLRTNTSGSPTFRSFLERVRETVIEAYVHQDVPFEKLVESLQPVRNQAYHPIFQVVFSLQNDANSSCNFTNLHVEQEIHDGNISQFDLSLQVSENEHGLNCLVEYSTELFELSTISQMFHHWQSLLEHIVGNPEQPVAKIPLLSSAERLHLIQEVNATEKDYPGEKCLQELFEEQVKRTPDTIAIVFGEQHLTYTELNQQANQLASYLQTSGVGPEVKVGICMRRGLEPVIAMLGTLKAGGAYVPIDPSYPEERISYVLKDSGTVVLLTQQALKTSHFSAYQIPVLCLDLKNDAIVQASKENPGLQSSSDNLAYIIYTSGSTGYPKGVMITHRSLCNHMLWMADTWPLTKTDSVLQRAPFGFDASVWECYAPLLAGARLVMAQPDDKGNSGLLISAIVEHGITIFQLTPALLQIFLEEPGLERCKSLKRVYYGGEALAMSLLHRFKSLLDVEMYNFYGQTESTIEMSCWQYTPECKRALAPLGSPIFNAQLYVLDPYLEPVPRGVAGEVFVSGICLSRGYLHLNELTAEKFIPNPFSQKPGERLYKSGDLAHYLPDGNLEFLGRVDHQVKLRGYRIELGEIEAILKNHPSLQDAIVIPLANDTGDKRLVAYIVLSSQDESLTTQELRDSLQTKLPDYMIPSSFVVMKALPVNASGKIDRQALPAPDWKQSRLEESYVAPSTPIETMLTAIWCEFLGLEKVSVDDNFFSLGGHSLLATRLLAKLRAVFPVEIPIRCIFDAPTISQFATFIEAKMVEKVEQLSQEEVQEILGKTSRV